MTAALLQARLLEVRRAFDDAFAALPTDRQEDVEALLAVRVAGNPYALRIREVSGIAACRKIVPVPSRRRELLGVAGLRGNVVPAYSLAALLGYGAGESHVAWLALCGRQDPVGLGFEDLEGLFRAPRADIRPGTVEVVGEGEQARPIVDIESVLEKLGAARRGAVEVKEA